MANIPQKGVIMAFDKVTLKRIRKLLGVEKVEISKGKLVVHTELIQLISPNNKKLYDVGRFKIIIEDTAFSDFQHMGTINNPELINKDIKLRKKEIIKGIIHPHIFYYGPCWGNMLDSIEPAIDNKDFFLATILCLQYLKNVNQGGGYSVYLEEAFPLSKGADEHETKPKK
jgi:hypothetical protein